MKTDAPTTGFQLPTAPIHSCHPTLDLLRHCPKTSSAFTQILSHFITTGLSKHTFPLSRLLLLFSSLPSNSPLLALPFALSLLSLRPSPSPFLPNTLTSSLASSHHHSLAFSLYSHLLSLPDASHPNAHTFPSLLKACVGPYLPFGRILHAHFLRYVVSRSIDPFVDSALLGYYSRCGKIESCYHLFDKMSNPDIACWNSMISALAKRCGGGEGVGFGLDVLFMFQQLQLYDGCRPDEMTMVGLVSACGDLGALMQGCWAHAYVERNGLDMNRYVATALIDMYAKCGRLELAEEVFDRTVCRDSLCYNAMIHGFAVHGQGQRAIELFGRMERDGVKVNDGTFVVVMSACAHAGMVAEGKMCFSRMKVDFGISPKVEHYGCLVDLLSRAGQLEEAEEVVHTMPVKPTSTIYRSLLGACKIYNNAEICRRVVHQLVELEPEHGGNYVLLSNVYAKISRWDDVGMMRKVMKDKGIYKIPGFSLVEVDGAIHEFIMGDRTHQLSKEIYSKLEEMDRRLHDFGYKPNTDGVLFDMEEEDKEDALSYHSERLAIAFGLLVSNSNTPIRIMKNLRICDDCHSTSKLISGIYGREIIMRDRSRFHHFRDWKCSCLDYW